MREYQSPDQHHGCQDEAADGAVDTAAFGVDATVPT